MTSTEMEIMTEKEYRALPYNSYSSFKDFITSRLKYYKKYILKEKIDETKEQGSDDLRFGNICDCLKFTPDAFDQRYVISTAVKPSGQMLDFVDILHSLTVKNTNEQGVLCLGIDRMIEEAYEMLTKKSATGKLRDSLDKFKERFLTNKEGYEYFLELKSREGRIVITTEELEWAQSIKDYMNSHPHTRDLMGLENSEQYEVKDQLMLIGMINGMEVKIMSDRVIFNKTKKIITPLDLKIMGNNEMFPWNYLKLKYYIQLAVYTTIIKQNYPDWIVKPLAFIAVDKYRQNDPIIYRTSEQQYRDAMKGFSIDGRKYKGLLEAIEELKWHQESNIWTTSKEGHLNKGFCDLKLNGQNDNETN